MKTYRSALLLLAVLLGNAPQGGQAAAINLATSPLYIGGNVSPLTMLDLSRDHQLSYKAYNDFTDLDQDGVIETTYKHSINYYGYFDSYKCYSYSSGMFVPQLVSMNKYCSGQWSGNFLNWVTMSRIDVVRKLLYGGMRSTDTAAQTVLERAYITTDARAWAKYYNGSDIAQLTTFNPPTTTTTIAATIDKNKTQAIPAAGDTTFQFSSAPSGISLGDQIKLAIDSSNYVIGVVNDIQNNGKDIIIRVSAKGISGSGSAENWTIQNLSSTGISFCNLTAGSTSGTNQYSDTNTNPPLMRVAQGNYALWNANERWQCYWYEQKNNTQAGFGGTRSNGNQAPLSGLNASAENPSQTTKGLGTGSALGQYIVRVEVCDPALLGNEKCKKYPSNNYKPIGLLQVYGDSDLMKFGLITGSYTKNLSGGVLRKNLASITDEINVTTDGTFKTPPSSGSIINTLNKLRVYGYDYNTGYYNDHDQCPWQLTSFTEGNCTSWGNPVSEIYLESLRYLAGKTANSSFNVTGNDKISGLISATWSNPLDTNNYCAPLSVLIFNASVSSYDDDQMVSPYNDFGIDAVAQTKLIGDQEGITGNSWFVGNNGTSNDGLCTAKTISNLGSVSGLCPEAPTLHGSYLMAGLAYDAHINKIRSDLTVPSQDLKSLKVDTYGVALATNVPKIQIPVPAHTGQFVTILPAYRLDLSSNGSGPFGAGTLVDFKVVAQDLAEGTGTFYVNWEDSQQGGDYDQDVWGIISYQISGNTITVTTDAISASTVNGQGFGYIISGTTNDGPHFHSGILAFDYNDPTNVTVKDGDGNTLNGGTFINTTGGCKDCQVDNPPTSVTYTLGSSSADLLKDPLWYAAKWGGFKENPDNANNLPDLVAEWDSKTAAGTAGSDGIPDNYFYVINPGALEDSLNKAFVAILESSSASSVATNSSSLNTGTRLYQARFNSQNWSGQLLSYQLNNTTGQIIQPPVWDAGQIINTQSPSTRQIITYDRDTAGGMAFTWSAINGLTDKTQRDALNAGNPGDSRGVDRVAYLRGDATNEGFAATNFRQRPTSKLGDIVNSNPWYVGAPQAGYPDPAYQSFRTTYLGRTPHVYVGANDGMLHGFNANTGNEVIGYVPGKVYTNLSKLTDQNFSHRYFVDGSPMVGDAQVGGGWKSVLVGGLNAGGQGYYALDVTDPTQFSESNAANLVLWEFTDKDDPDLGYTYNQPMPISDQVPDAAQIRKMKNDKWAVIVGNGYNNSKAETGEIVCTASSTPTGCTTSLTGHAVLYILFLQGPASGTWTPGTNFIKIDTGAGSLSSPNGLATPLPVDIDGDDVVDYVYAGDLQGNLWKFNLTDSNPANWTVALSGSPLFTAKDASNNVQPITSAPVVTPHPNGGFMIDFGTGKYLEGADIDPSNFPYKTQTLYGIWDKGDGTTVAGSTLVQQTVIGTVNNNGTTYRLTSQNPIDWIAQKGWYLDLPTSGERVAYNPLLRFGRFVAVTLIPSNSPCEFGGTSWLMELDYLTGSRLATSPVDVNGDTKFSEADLVTISTESGGQKGAVSGIPLTIGITPTPTIISNCAGGECKEFSGTSNATQTVTESVPLGVKGRINWIELTQ